MIRAISVVQCILNVVWRSIRNCLLARRLLCIDSTVLLNVVWRSIRNDLPSKEVVVY